MEMFVDKLLHLVDRYHIERDKLQPGQTLWPAVAIDEAPGYRKPIYATRQVPLVLTLVHQEDLAAMRQGSPWTEILQGELVRALQEAHAQGGLLTTSDLSVLFHHGHSRVAELIRQSEIQTGEGVPRRGNLHDMGRTLTHKRILCRKAFLEGKTTDVIAREMNHSPEAVDNYLLDFARIYYAIVLKGMSLEEATFAIQRPQSLVEEYVKLLMEFGLNNQRLSDRIQIQLERCKMNVSKIERREQPPS